MFELVLHDPVGAAVSLASIPDPYRFLKARIAQEQAFRAFVFGFGVERTGCPAGLCLEAIQPCQHADQVEAGE